jgi:putative anticodon nuclease
MEPRDYNSLEEIAKELRDSKKKTTLLYAFNGTGKTRLSMSFKDLVSSPSSEDSPKKRVIYYNAFTEDLFNWENDLESDLERVLKINTSSMFVDLMRDYGKEAEVIEKFQRFTFSKIEPQIDYHNGEIKFRLATGDNRYADNIKISRGEERILIWAIFYVLIDTVINELNNESVERSTEEFNEVSYIFIDDPISSLDDNNVVEIALDLCDLISKSKNEDLHFIISTHHPFFFNVLHTELKKADKYLLRRKKTNYSVESIEKQSPFGYHLLLKEEIENAIKTNTIKRYHFNLLRNLLEKSAHFLGYTTWRELISIENKDLYIKQINSFSHSDHTDEEAEMLKENEENLFKLIYNSFVTETKWKE